MGSPRRTDTNVRIEYDVDETLPTLEPQLVEANGQAVVETILGRTFGTTKDLEAFMAKNKTDCALRFFETKEDWTVPGYILRAVS